MKKRITGSIAATVALLAIAGIANAAPAELNIYGSSAQYTYWNDQAQDFAQNTTTGLGCTATAPVNNGGKHGFVSATGCTSTLVPVNTTTGHRDLNIRYSGIASAEGILAIGHHAPLNSSYLQADFDVNGNPPTPPATKVTCNAANGERAMYYSASQLQCKVVTVGTSDVEGSSLYQNTISSNNNGPMGGGVVTNTLPPTGPSVAGLTANPTVFTPFGFFANKAVTVTKCTGGLIGNYATSAAQCASTPGGSDGALGAPTTISNISRAQAVMIFSGQAADWADFGAYYTDQQIIACMRQAGSGTHAALDITVMNGGNTGWGSQVPTGQQIGGGGLAGNGGSEYIWFNSGSGNMMDCINGDNNLSGPGAYGTATGSLVGAIGYADASQLVGDSTHTNIVPLAYNGVYPTRATIRNGLYDFYSIAQLYTNNTPSNSYDNAITGALVAYASNPANVPTALNNYWGAVSEMWFERASDAGYIQIVGASNPQLP